MTHEKKIPEQELGKETKWAYLCTFAVPFLGFGTGTMMGAHSRLMNSVQPIERKLKESGWEVKEVTYDQGGHYFKESYPPYSRDIFYNTYEAIMRGIKSKDISRDTLEKIARTEGLKLIKF